MGAKYLLREGAQLRLEVASDQKLARLSPNQRT